MEFPPIYDERCSKPVDRFWPNVQVGEPDECWLWTGRRDGLGYGVLTVKGRNVGVHRLAYELLVGEVPAGRHIHHRCKVQACCNPAHLESLPPGRHSRIHNPARTECDKCGGPLTVTPHKNPKNGMRRVCKSCDAIRTSRRYRKDGLAEDFMLRLREEFAEADSSTYIARLEREVRERIRENVALMAENKKLRLNGSRNEQRPRGG